MQEQAVNEPRNGVLTVKVIEAADLKQMDVMGKNDAYCVLVVGQSSKRTSTITSKMLQDQMSRSTLSTWHLFSPPHDMQN